MNRAFWIVLGPTALVAVGYILVLRKMGLDPPYGRLASIVVVMGMGLWWLGKKSARNRL